MSVDLTSLASEALDWMRGRLPSVEAEVYVGRGSDRTLRRRRGARDGVETAAWRGAGVRLVSNDGRVGFSSAGAADAETLRGLWKQAAEQLRHSAPEDGRRLPSAAAAGGDDALDRSLWDETLFSRSWDELEKTLTEAESAVGHGIRVLRSEIGENRCETVIANTLGVRANSREGSIGVAVSAAAENGAETQVSDGVREARRISDLDAAAAGREAAVRAAAGIGSGRARGGKRAVVFEPWVGSELLELVADMLSAEQAQSGRSLLAGRQGQRVAASGVALRDDPRRPAGPASARFDDEGVPTRDKALIKDGILTEFFHDSATAARAKTAPNGCGWRSGYGGLPGPGPSNFYLAPGNVGREALLSSTRDGVLVLEMLGAHMVDPVSGEFSVGVSGVEWKGGARGKPFKGAMLSGNLLDLLARVDAVADDLAFYGSIGAPTFRVADLDLS